MIHCLIFLLFISIHLMITVFERSLEKRVAQEILITEVVQSKRMIPFTIKSFKKVSSGILLNLYDMNLKCTEISSLSYQCYIFLSFEN